MPVDPVGVWGIPTASIDWCEQNYAVTPWVAEFWNTLSSLAMVAAGLLGLLTRRFGRGVRLAFGLLVLVGLGSIAFHGTLRFELQMLDELPMLYLVTWLVWLLVENGPGPPTRRSGSPRRSLGYVLLATAGATLNRGDAQFLAFHVSFGALEILLPRAGDVARAPSREPRRARAVRPRARRLRDRHRTLVRGPQGLSLGERHAPRPRCPESAAPRLVARAGLARLLPPARGGLLREGHFPPRRPLSKSPAFWTWSLVVGFCPTAGTTADPAPGR